MRAAASSSHASASSRVMVGVHPDDVDHVARHHQQAVHPHFVGDVVDDHLLDVVVQHGVSAHGRGLRAAHGLSFEEQAACPSGEVAVLVDAYHLPDHAHQYSVDVGDDAGARDVRERRDLHPHLRNPSILDLQHGPHPALRPPSAVQ
eukprot:CAMPEP_0177708756 /NCGR_PEP_ID=MMETSP0484_2-20121128/10443_1 /TAXON_ID=354590 /ORGANISM="Rhodomonas lens, Strain RHODO" /LENGTH=146 /DNA_ID=CAMNT_0019220335 /DNA_START=287 /DNA_END=728 /DNA_ORIENTATION=+